MALSGAPSPKTDAERVKTLLTGEYLHTIDAKSRVFVPAKLREALGEVFVLARNVDGCLSLYPMDEWNRLNEKLMSLPDSQTRAVKRFLFTFAAEVSPDSQGRITLPQGLRDFAGLQKEAAFLGVGDRAELWAAEKWEAIKNGSDADEISSIMKELGI